MTPDIIYLIAKPETRKVFEAVVEKLTIRFKDLVDSLDLDENEVAESLGKLEQAKLIEESSAPLRDFKTFYVTADGLSANRELRRLAKVPGSIRQVKSDRAKSAS